MAPARQKFINAVSVYVRAESKEDPRKLLLCVTAPIGAANVLVGMSQ